MTRPHAEVVILNKRGLHARASTRFVTTAAAFDAVVTVSKDGNSVTGTSIMGLMMLVAGVGETIMISAEGPEAQAAVDALVALVARKFDEE